MSRIRCVGVGIAGCAIAAAAGVDGAAEDAGGGVTGLRRSIFCNNLRIWGTEACADWWKIISSAGGVIVGKPRCSR